jgi:hypothetical protein
MYKRLAKIGANEQNNGDKVMQSCKHKKVLEADVETAHSKNVTKRGGWSLKFTSPARRNVPDRVDLYSIDAAAKRLSITLERLKLSAIPETLIYLVASETVAAAIQFTELKKPGVYPSEAQIREHERLRKRGFIVNVVDEIV